MLTPGRALAGIVATVLVIGALPAIVDALAFIPGVGLVAVGIFTLSAVALVAIELGRMGR